MVLDLLAEHINKPHEHPETKTKLLSATDKAKLMALF